MSLTPYSLSIRDHSVVPPGLPKTGLTPTWRMLKRHSDNGDITPQPAITEVAYGAYKFNYDAELYGDAIGQIDCGAALANPSDRYIDVLLTREAGRIIAALTAAGANLNLAQAVPVANTAETVGDALNAARAAGFGKSVVDKTADPPTWTFFASNGTTPVRTFTLDDANNPTTRT